MKCFFTSVIRAGERERCKWHRILIPRMVSTNFYGEYVNLLVYHYTSWKVKNKNKWMDCTVLFATL